MLYNYAGKERQIEILRSLRNIGENDQLYDIPECVEITAFKGDTLVALSKYAYEDIIPVKFFENVGGINLLISKNAQLCRKHLNTSDEKQNTIYEPEPSKEFEGGESLRFYNCEALGYVPFISDGTLLDYVFAKKLNITRVIGGVAEPEVKTHSFEMINGSYQEIKSQKENRQNEVASEERKSEGRYKENHQNEVERRDQNQEESHPRRKQKLESEESEDTE